MSSIYGTLNVALQSLQAQQAGLATTSNNIANVNTPGYSRQIATLEETAPLEPGGPGDGVRIANVSSISDSVLELRVTQETQTQAGLTSYLNAAQQAQTQFTDTSGSGIQNSISGFFSSLQQLSTDPANVPDRQAVLLAAQNLAQTFNGAAASLTTQQNGLDSSVVDAVTQVNTLTSQIAKLNGDIQQSQGAGINTGVQVDHRTQLIRQLSQLVDIAVVPSGGGGVTVETPSGAPLVVGINSVKLTTAVNVSTGHQDIYSQGQDITSTIQGGQIGGNLKARDQLISGALRSLDQLAAGIASAVNAQHQSGTDLSGAAGGNFFVPPPAGGAGAAGLLSVAITDPSKIAASSDGSSGSNGNVTAIAALAFKNIVNGSQPGDAYANLVAGVGSAVQNAASEQTASNLTLQQLQTQRDSLSGVNLDEESAALIQFQKAYQAASRVAAVINGLIDTAINIGSGS